VFILDTNVISHPATLASLQPSGDHLFLSVITVSELQFGASLLTERGHWRKARELQSWIDSVVSAYEGRLLSVDVAIARRTGEMLAKAEQAGFKPGYEDAVIAATAAIRGMTVLTFNQQDFRALGANFRVP
jgi:toxin FitB